MIFSSSSFDISPKLPLLCEFVNLLSELSAVISCVSSDSMIFAPCLGVTTHAFDSMLKGVWNQPRVIYLPVNPLRSGIQLLLDGFY